MGGADTISAGAGNDVIFGGQAGDTIFAGADNDVILGDAGYLKLDDSPIFVIAEKKDWDLGTHFTLETRNQAVGGDDSIFGNAGNDIIIGGSFDDYMEGNDGNDAIIGDQGGATYRDTTDRLEIHTKELLAENNGNDTLFGNAGNDELLGGAFEDDLFGGANDDILIGDEGEVYYGFVPREPGKEYHDSLPRMARSTESFTGRHDTLDSGSGVDFILGGEQPNFIVADKKLDLVQIENGEFRIDEKRNSKTEFPAFQGDPILQPQAAYFAKDVPSTDPSVLRNNEPSSTTQSSGSGFGGVTQGSTGASQTINLNARGTFDTAMIPQVMIPQRTSSVVDNTIAEFIEGATLLEPVRHASDGQAGGGTPSVSFGGQISTPAGVNDQSATGPDTGSAPQGTGNSAAPASNNGTAAGAAAPEGAPVGAPGGDAPQSDGDSSSSGQDAQPQDGAFLWLDENGRYVDFAALAPSGGISLVFDADSGLWVNDAAADGAPIFVPELAQGMNQPVLEETQASRAA
ncbi:calcium-binding protein [Thalassospira sp. TSL5-1]|uniref:calcium-binding protein n=1 Tax=Thalassospira sp. TSL5-1 TaxID=1544451 RepID=UPI00352D1A9E